MTLKIWAAALTLPMMVSFASLADTEQRPTYVSTAGDSVTATATQVIQLAQSSDRDRYDNRGRHSDYERNRECRDEGRRDQRRDNYRDCRRDQGNRFWPEHRRDDDRRDVRFVDVRAANIRSKPHRHGYVIDTKYRCEPVRIEQPVRGGDWYKVRTRGVSGFMHASVLSRHAPRRCRHQL